MCSEYKKPKLCHILVGFVSHGDFLQPVTVTAS